MPIINLHARIQSPVVMTIQAAQRPQVHNTLQKLTIN